MSKAFYIDFVSSMYVYGVETREDAEKVFWERMAEAERDQSIGICWTEINCIEEDEIEED